MPYLIRRPGVQRLACAALGVLALAAASPAAASASCSVNTNGETQPFASIGDSNWYNLAPGGSFTNGAPGWSINGSVTSGGSGTNSYITVTAGGTAISPPFCVSSATPDFRFYARKTSATQWDSMNFAIVWTNALGQRQVTTIGNWGPSSNWQVSVPYGLGAILPVEGGQSFMLQLEFEPLAGGSNIQLSDVDVDPYSRT